MPNLFALPGPRNGPDNVTSQQPLADGFHHVVASDTHLYASLPRMFWSDHNNIDFTNQGVIWNISSQNVGSCIAGFYIWEFANEGMIVSEATNGNAGAISILGGGYFLSNSGSIYAVANGNANAITHWGPGVFVVNAGLIAAYAPNASSPGGGGGSAIGFALFNGGDFGNESSATVLAEGVHATAVLMATGTIANYGRLEAVSLTDGEPGYGVRAGGLYFQVNTLVNHGLIRADIAWSSNEAHPIYGPRSIDRLYNMENGRILGDIETGRGNDELVNSGTIEGDVRLGDGNDLFDGSLGTLAGVVDLGWDNDVFQGSAAGDLARGDRGADMLAGAGGQQPKHATDGTTSDPLFATVPEFFRVLTHHLGVIGLQRRDVFLICLQETRCIATKLTLSTAFHRRGSARPVHVWCNGSDGLPDGRGVFVPAAPGASRENEHDGLPAGCAHHRIPDRASPRPWGRTAPRADAGRARGRARPCAARPDPARARGS